MSFWTFALFVYLVLSITVFVLIMSMFILGKRSDERSPYSQDETPPQPHAADPATARHLSDVDIPAHNGLRLPRPYPLTLSRLAALRSDSSGAVVIIAALSMPLVAAGMGLGAETGYHYMQQRKLQHAVDMAAHAGAIRLRAGAKKEQIEAASWQVATQTGFMAEDGTITVHTPPTSGPRAGVPGSVEVILTETHPRYFSAIFVEEPVHLKTRAVASVMPSNSKACVLALSPTAPGAITLSGSTDVSLEGCDVASNSNAGNAFSIGGSAGMTVGCVHTVGEATISTGLKLACPAVNTYAPVVRDPYADIGEPIPEEKCFTGSKDTEIFEPVPSPNGMSLLFCGGLDIKKHVTFKPGLYIIKDGDLSLNANGTVTAGEASINANGATFYLAGNAKLRLSGNGSLNLKAPTTGPYAGILIFASRSQVGVTHEILGNAGSITQGVIYAPSAAIRFTGNSTTTGGCTQIIGNTVEFTGHSTLKSSCETSNAREIQTNVMVQITE
ncbi:hypothetical protein E4191_16455 (plasmid) [Paracoccus liaowanqingii]|uniref:Uncharacterized protein n=1 Tax=Paracoccus liaowanqingii TaxID=2560053 RepID=A0A4Y5SQF9_9RHOB|nr:pilus assembly protein TadG-related protein [Paracoccus liaowanqingii]QDA35752.1 hypothetical protein E4191_16455 [Paracoccus liaowanqingii]